MRSIALDVHRAFCEVAIKDGQKLRSGGRIKTSVAELELFAQRMEEELDDVVGPKGRHDPDRAAVRHGHEQGVLASRAPQAMLRPPS